MPRYYKPTISGEIRPGTRETAAIGSGPKTHKRGESCTRAEVLPDNGRTVSIEFRTLRVDGSPIRRISVWAMYNRCGERVGHKPHNDKPDPPPGGWVQRETIDG
jgi:hypothetical protein